MFIIHNFCDVLDYVLDMKVRWVINCINFIISIYSEPYIQNVVLQDIQDAGHVINEYILLTLSMDSNEIKDTLDTCNDIRFKKTIDVYICNDNIICL